MVERVRVMGGGDIQGPHIFFKDCSQSPNFLPLGSVS